MRSFLKSIGRAFPHALTGTVLIAFCCCGCGGDEEADSDQSAASNTSPESAETGGLGSFLGSLRPSQQGDASSAGAGEATAAGADPAAVAGATTPQATPGEVAATTLEPEAEEYDPHLDPATWLEFAADIPIYPGTERGSGWSFQDGQEFHNDGGWSTSDSYQQVYDWYLAELPRQGWTTGTTGYQGPRGISTFEGTKANRLLIVSISAPPTFGGDDGENEYLIHIKEVTYSR
jgi:hypothetical protein